MEQLNSIQEGGSAKVTSPLGLAGDAAVLSQQVIDVAAVEDVSSITASWPFPQQTPGNYGTNSLTKVTWVTFSGDIGTVMWNLCYAASV